MLEIAGYAIERRIYATEQSAVYSGMRSSDGLAVILKVYRGDATACSMRARRESQLLQRIDHPGVARAVELRAFEDRHVLVLERFKGASLENYLAHRRFTCAELLSIALGITQSLAAVHDARIIHKDVKPGNVLLDPETLRVCLIDFGLSRELGRAERAAQPQAVEGTMHYVAPEQTGRLGRGVDFRSDLYSLGASLYELFTGEPPFASKSGAELIHAHLALPAPCASDIAPRVPMGISRMLQKLLEKDPELRYQTARGLAADLETWRKQLETTGEIDDGLTLGTRDASDRLRFPNRLYGREHECRELRAAFERAARGNTEIVVLTGPAGIGKSSLPGTLREDLAAKGGYLIDVKFDPSPSDHPYAGFARALESFVDQILAESRERLAMWHERIRGGVGDIGRVLLDLTPHLALVVSDFPEVAPLNAEEARQRMATAAARLLGAVARPEHPLVLFFDDVQWADSDSLFLLRAALGAPEPMALLVIGGCREMQTGAESSVEDPIERLAPTNVSVQRHSLQPLRTEDVNLLLSDALGRLPHETAWLAECVALKSQCNPLLVRRLLFHLWDRDLIWHEHDRGWIWDPQRISESDISDDAAALMATRIEKLPATTRRILEIGSLLGNVFDLEMLVDITGVDAGVALQQLMALVEQGWISPCREGFRFVHDRLREAARSNLPKAEEPELHHRAAAILIDRLDSPELTARIFEVVDHLVRAGSKIDEAMRARAIAIAREAGAIAQRTGALQSASHYLQFARSLVRGSDWAADPSVLCELFLLSSKCAYQASDFELGLALLEPLERLQLAPNDRVRIDVQRIRLFTASRSTRETLDLSLQILWRYGVRWSRRPGRLRILWEIWRTDRLLRGDPERWRLEPTTRPSIDWVGPMLIKSAAGQAHSLTSVRLVCRTASDALRAYFAHGFVRPPGFSIAAFAVYRAAVLRHLGGLKRYAQAALSWNERCPDPAFGPKTEYLIYAFAYVWIRPRRSVVAPLARIAQELQEIGDVEYATNALYFRCAPLALSGAPLSETVAAFAQLPVWLGMDALAQAPSLAEPFRRLMDPEGGVSDAMLSDVEEKLRHSPDSSSRPFLVTNWLLCLCILGRYRDAYRLSEYVRDTIFEVHSTGSHVADYTFFRGLAAATLASSARWRERRRYVQELNASLRQLEIWAEHGPDFVHMAELLRAELESLRGRFPRALRSYRSAAQRAQASGYIHHAALCRERCAELLITARRELEADSERASAHALYLEWGAFAKVSARTESRE